MGDRVLYPAETKYFLDIDPEFIQLWKDIPFDAGNPIFLSLVFIIIIIIIINIFFLGTRFTPIMKRPTTAIDSNKPAKQRRKKMSTKRYTNSHYFSENKE